VICHGYCLTAIAAVVPIRGNFQMARHFLRFFIGLHGKPAPANICAEAAI